MALKGKKPITIKRYALGVLLLWAILITCYAIFVFLVPHSSAFASEVGINAAFVFFSAAFSIVYLFLAFLFGVALFAATSTPESDV